MRSLRQVAVVVSLFGLVGAGVTAAAPMAIGTAPPATKPVIGKPVAVPTRAVAGKPFSVSFKVTRGDTGTPLRGGKMICDPSVAGVVVSHVESFKGGVARLVFVVPENAAGKVLKVTLTIRAAGRSATRIARFGVEAAPLPSVSIGDVSAAEGNQGTTTFTFPVTLSAPATQTVSVGYATADGTALALSDYAAASGTVTFDPGVDATTIAISVVGDPVTEPNETFTIALSNPRNAALAKSTATGTITDDELVLLSPTQDAAIPQNVSTIGCPARFGRGYGYSITFEWRTDHRTDISAFQLRAFHEGATLPIVSAVIPGAESTSYTTRECNAFVADTNLTGWHWSVTATDSQGNPVIWAQGTFAFAPCRLANGAACYAAP